MDAVIQAVLVKTNPVEAVSLVNVNFIIPCQTLDTQVEAKQQCFQEVGNKTKVHKVDMI